MRSPSRPAPREAGAFWRPILSGTGWLLAAQAGRLALQAGAVLLVARGLGAEGLGAVAVLIGVANIVRPLAGFGTHVLVVQEVARDRGRMGESLAAAIPAHLAGGILLTVAGALWIAPQLGIDLPPLWVALLLLGELLLGGLYALLSNTWQAEERFARQAAYLLLLPALRFLGLLALFLAGGLTLPRFVIAQSGAVALAVAAGLLWRAGRSGLPGRVSPARCWRAVREGLPFAVALAGLGLLPEIDKLLLPRLAGLAAAGEYAAGTKAINFAVLPLGSLLGVLLPRFFRDGAQGGARALALARRAWRLSLLYAILGGGALALAAPLAWPLLGREAYPQVPAILRAAAPLLLLQAIHMPAGDALAACGGARFRALAQTGAALAAGLAAYLAIPAWGWRGALAAAYAGHALLALLLVARLWTRGQVDAPPR